MQTTVKRTLLGAFASALIALAACLAFALPAHAEEMSGSDGWLVKFTGDKVESNFTSTGITDSIRDLQPGDTAVFSVNIKNGVASSADWYMRNSIVKTLEETTVGANGGAYIYELAYINPAGEKSILYKSDTVGGDATEGQGEGLKSASGALEDYFFIDTLGTNSAAKVELSVGLDGETQGNAYSNAFAQMEMVFAADPVDEGTAGNGGNGGSNGNGSNGGPNGNGASNNTANNGSTVGGTNAGNGNGTGNGTDTNGGTNMADTNGSGTLVAGPAGDGSGAVRQDRNSASFVQTGDKMLVPVLSFCFIGLAGLMLLLVAIRKTRTSANDR